MFANEHLRLKKHGIKFLILVSIYLLAWLIQDALFINWDVSVLINSTRQWLNGGSYVNDFFTPNPPMILYLYSPIFVISKLLNLDIVIAIRIYFFLFASISFGLCYFLIPYLISKQNQSLYFIFIVFLLASYLIFPLQDFGQRDHLLLMTTMPYLLLVAYRLEGHSVKPGYGIVIGFFTSLGFALKPQFLITLFLIESYYIFQRGNWRALLRVETTTILITFLIYLLALFLFFQDYLFIIIPYMSRFYYQSVSQPWLTLIVNDKIFFCLIPIVIYVIQYKQNKHKIISSILLIALIGFLFSFFAQRSTFFYHIIPAFSVAILLLLLLFQTFIKKPIDFFIILLVLFFFLFPIYILHDFYQRGLVFKKTVLNNLIAFMRTQPPHQSIYVLSQGAYLSTPLIEYTRTIVSQRFDCLWMVSDLIKRYKGQSDFSLRQYIKNNNDKYFFVNLIAEDFNKHKPNLVFVDVRKINIWLGENYAYFDFVNYFSENPKFKREWNAYQYLTTLSSNDNQYQLKVYKRREEL